MGAASLPLRVSRRELRLPSPSQGALQPCPSTGSKAFLHTRHFARQFGQSAAWRHGYLCILPDGYVNQFWLGTVFRNLQLFGGFWDRASDCVAFTHPDLAQEVLLPVATEDEPRLL